MKEGKVEQCYNTEFHGIECFETGEEYGFEDYYNDDLNHPDPRPGHAIWLKKKDAEHLFRLFAKNLEEMKNE